MEVLLAGTGLLVLAPLMVVVSLLILVTMGSPVFFRQERVGRSGKLFKILKFRTMRPDSELIGGKLTVGGRDPRVTRIGAFLRRSKFDEFPQLLNVLRGEMRFVGPRPEVPEYVALWGESERAVVLSSAPGITDLASIAFRRENELLARAADPERYYVERILPRKLRMNVRYLETRTTRRDLGVITETLRRAVARG